MMRDCACGSRCTTCADVVVPPSTFGNFESATFSTLFAGPFFDRENSGFGGAIDPLVCGSPWPDLVTFTLAQQQAHGGEKVWNELTNRFLRRFVLTGYDFSPMVSGPDGTSVVDPDAVDFAFDLEYKRGLGLWQGQFASFAGQSLDSTFVIEAYPISTAPSWSGSAPYGYACMRYYSVRDGKRITPVFGTRYVGLIGTEVGAPAVKFSTLYSDFDGNLTGSMSAHEGDLPKILFNVPRNYTLDTGGDIGSSAGVLYSGGEINVIAGLKLNLPEGSYDLYYETFPGRTWCRYGLSDREEIEPATPFPAEPKLHRVGRMPQDDPTGLVNIDILGPDVGSGFVGSRVALQGSLRALGDSTLVYPGSVANQAAYGITLPAGPATLTFAGW